MSARHPTKLVIFDCDGVLIDSEAISASILIKELQAINIEIEFDYVLKNFLGRSFPKVAAEIGNWFSSPLPVNLERVCNECWAVCEDMDVAADEIVAAMKQKINF